MGYLTIIEQIKALLERVFGIPADRVDPTDHVGADWGLVNHERKRLESELYHQFPTCAESFRDCETIDDFARMVAP